jgi:probable F420-dependent oxidoreductase
MKFGLLLPNYGPTASKEMIEQSARLAEVLGFDSVWTTDHVLVPTTNADPYGILLESLIALTLAATVTSRVQLGTSIIVTPQREPVLLAKQLAALDVLSGGRLVLGAGVGWMEKEFQFLGADFAQRGEIFDEGLQVLRTLWKGEQQFQGIFTTFAEALFAPLPLKRDQLPIWIGGNSQNAIRRAATLADAWHPVGLTPTELSSGAAQLRALAAGRQVMVTLRTNVELLDEDGLDSQQNFAAPGQILRGTPDEIGQILIEYREAELEYAVIWFFHTNWDDLKSRVVQFADKVMPLLK